jgi:monoamine oxidase
MAAARGLFAAHRDAEDLGRPVDEVLQARAERQAARGQERLYSRRQVLCAAGAIAGAVSAAGSPALGLARVLSRPQRPRIAIVGAGLAGVRCAHTLWTLHPRAPIAATVYEANPDRAGGRCWTLRGFFDAGLLTEHGGAFLNTPQRSIRRLAAQLGLAQEVVNGGDLPSGEEVYLIDGRRYTYQEANADWESIGFTTFRAAARELRTQAGERRLDAMSVPEWLESTEIGTASRFGKLMMANAVTENGGDPDQLSALDLIELTAGNPRSSLQPIPGDDERFHVVGGNDQIVTRMIEELPAETVRHGHELVAVRANADGTVTLSFDVGATAHDVTADLVVLALPFSTLRMVDLSRSGLSQAKQTVIRTLGMGFNAKIHVELSHKTWPGLGFSGASYGEWDRFCCAWDDSVALGAGASPALYLGFPGGRVGDVGLTGAAHGPAPAADVDWFLSQIEKLYPGTRAAYTGRAYEDHWALDPWVRGAYSYYGVGQASSYPAIAAAAEGPFMFAGEHTSSENQGFLDGAVETGERAAAEVTARVRL